MPWKHEGRRVRITHDIDMGELGGLVRRGEKGTVTFANRVEGIFEIALDTKHTGLEDNVLAFSPMDAEDPAVERDRLSEAMRFVRSHSAVLALGGFLVGVVAPIESPFDGRASAAHHLAKTCTRLMEYEGKLYRLTVNVNDYGNIMDVAAIEPIQEDELPHLQ